MPMAHDLVDMEMSADIMPGGLDLSVTQPASALMPATQPHCSSKAMNLLGKKTERVSDIASTQHATILPETATKDLEGDART